ncbi:hypothetical protein X474_19315 [Dethiosulfatarculus sandiegensis]|uniref:Uncharacterized protein n=1 Tax=Dethiosulfatarculus sandiegensis TaxID=1429043 RepID=A0A0D2J9G9_9BACT|nr:hypothetical protein X474_19315 [Dethiosulfatarculus sandiegensis]
MSRNLKNDYLSVGFWVKKLFLEIKTKILLFNLFINLSQGSPIMKNIYTLGQPGSVSGFHREQRR